MARKVRRVMVPAHHHLPGCRCMDQVGRPRMTRVWRRGGVVSAPPLSPVPGTSGRASSTSVRAGWKRGKIDLQWTRAGAGLAGRSQTITD